jgi:hypothetical protein
MLDKKSTEKKKRIKSLTKKKLSSCTYFPELNNKLFFNEIW